MDDGNSWIGIVLFAASVILFAVMYGFGAAVQALNTSALEDERDEGNKKAAALLRIQEDPGKFVRTNQVVTCFFTLALGAFTLPQTAGYIRRFLAVIKFGNGGACILQRHFLRWPFFWSAWEL